MMDFITTALIMPAAIAVPFAVVFILGWYIRSAIHTYQMTGKHNIIASAALTARDWLSPFHQIGLVEVADDDPNATVKRMKNRWKLIHLRPFVWRWALLTIILGITLDVYDGLQDSNGGSIL